MTAAKAAMPLFLPPSIYGLAAPASYLHANLTSSSAQRANGRQPSEFRKPIVQANSLRHCLGSAVVRKGDTAVVCGVRGEILRSEDIAKPSQVDIKDPEQDEGREMRLLVPNIEMATGASPAFLPGNPPSTLAQSLSQRVYDTLHTTRLVSVEDLRILHQPLRSVDEEMEEPDVTSDMEVKAYWVLYIDILFISLDGNAFDAAWEAMLAALINAKLPKAWWDADIESVVCSDKASDASPLRLRCSPVPVTFAVFDSTRHKGTGEDEVQFVLADPDAFEEGLCDETVTITVDGSQIHKIEKSGGTVVDKATMGRLAQDATQNWHDFVRVIDGLQRGLG